MDRPKSINRDNSKRFYMSDAEYPEHIRRTSDKEKDIEYKEKHSEFKKPWGPSDNFQEMEYWLDPPPGIDPWIFDDPVSRIDIPPDIRLPEGDLTVLYCRPDDCYNDNEETCIFPNCSYPIIGVTLAGAYPGFSVRIQSGQICITAPEDASPAIEINIYMEGTSPDGRTVTGSHGSILIEKCDECEEADELAGDGGINPATIDQSSSETVAVTGGVGPYDWEVAGTGFSLDNAQTAGLSNTLNAGESACGTAVITVTDVCEQTATIEVRSTGESGWVHVSYWVCVLPGAPDSWGPEGRDFFYSEKIVGIGRQQDQYFHYICNNGETCDDCIDRIQWQYPVPLPQGTPCIDFDCVGLEWGSGGSWPCCWYSGGEGGVIKMATKITEEYFEWGCD